MPEPLREGRVIGELPTSFFYIYLPEIWGVIRHDKLLLTNEEVFSSVSVFCIDVYLRSLQDDSR